MLRDTSERTKIIAVIAVLFAASMVAIWVGNESGRSDVSPSLPIAFNDTEYDGYVVVDGERNYNAVFSSNLSIDYEADGVYHCSALLTVSPDWLASSATMSYRFEASADGFVPSGSDYVGDDGEVSVYRMEYPLTGDILTFHVSDDGFERIDFSGRTVITDMGSREFVEFEASVGFSPNMRYVANQDLPLPADIAYDVTGTVGGESVSGTVTISAEAHLQQYNEEGYTTSDIAFYKASADVDDQILSDIIDRMTIADYGDGIQTSMSDRFLKGDVLTRIVMDVEIESDGFTCEGYILTEVLDDECNVVSSQRTDVSLTGVAI